MITNESIQRSVTNIVVTTSETVIFESNDVGEFTNKMFYIRNTGATAFNLGRVYVSPNPSSATPLWILIDSTTFNTLAAGASTVFFTDRNFRAFRLTASVSSGTSTASVWFDVQ